MDPVSVLLGIGSKLADHFFPNKKEADQKKIEMLALIQSGDLKELEVAMSAIVAEANSKDKWTSRARPSFMYLMYLTIIMLVMVTPIIGIWHPDSMKQFYTNVGLGFAAIPEAMWWTFTTGYLGYTGARTYEKRKKLAK